MALTQISTEGIKNGTITGSDLATNVDLVDDQKLRFGNSNDLQIFHSNSSSTILNNNGILRLQDDLFIVLEKLNGDNMLRCDGGGSVNLYYNGSLKLETKSNGINVTGRIFCDGAAANNRGLIFNDNVKISLGSSNDLEIYHDGSNSYIQNSTLSSLYINSASHIYLANADNSEFKAKFHNNSSVQLFYDGSKKFETTSTGITVSGSNTTGSRINGSLVLATDGGTTNLELFGSNGVLRFYDNRIASFGTGDDLKIFHESSSNDNIIDCGTTRPLRIRMGGSNQFEFLSGGGIKMNDGRKIFLGDSSDFQIYHDGNHSYIQDAGTGALILVSNQVVMQNAAQTENMFAAIENAGCNLYYDNVKRFETTSSGVNVTGAITVNGSALTTATNSPAFSVKLSSTTNRNGEGTVVFDSEHLDTDSCYDTSNGRFTPDVAGNYMLTFTFVMNGSSSGIIAGAFGAIRKNGSTIIARFWTDPMQSNNNQLNRASCSGSAIVPMNGSSDFIEIRAYGLTTTGGNVRISDDGSNFSGFKLA